MAVGGSADDALMTPSNTASQIDTEVVAARCRERFDTTLRLVLLVLRTGNHGFETLLAIGRWLPKTIYETSPNKVLSNFPE
jgi:hypothetical protein